MSGYDDPKCPANRGGAVTLVAEAASLAGLFAVGLVAAALFQLGGCRTVALLMLATQVAWRSLSMNMPLTQWLLIGGLVLVVVSAFWRKCD